MESPKDDAGQTVSGPVRRDVTAEVHEVKLGPIIGRRKEILQVIQTLARRTKNNPVLVGEAGVGKTAEAEPEAIRVAAFSLPEGTVLKRCLIVSGMKT
ncbi:MAG: hypothetical protein QHH07_12215 [Sedimentisphaerales bacterium]|nr:hypothetical protein [Sedimentisphaerales bacterium]